MENIAQYVVPVSANKPKVLSLVPADPGSRYKMRQLQIQVVGKSKMIKTVFANILDVSKDMQVPPQYIGTFMGYEIGAMAKFDEKKPERQQASISGEHEIKDLSKLVHKFITEVVLCPVCGLPEVVLEVAKNKIFGPCRACGGNDEMKITNEKFKRYIVNHPPAKGKSFAAKTSVEKREEKVKNSSKREADAAAKDASTKESKDIESPEEEEEAVVWYSDTSAQAREQRRAAMVPDAVKLENGAVGNGAKRDLNPEELATAVNALDLNKLQLEKNETGLSSEAFIKAIVESVSVDIENLAKKFKVVLAKYASSEATQVALVNAIEEQVAKQRTDLLPKAPMLLKALYDEDIVVEETLLLWSNSKHANLSPSFREAVTPFIRWLQETDEESEDEDEEDTEALLDSL